MMAGVSHEVLDGDESYLGDADEMEVEESRGLCMEEELASLRGEKCYLEYRTTELEDQVAKMKTQAAQHDSEDDRTIKRLEEELLAYKEGIDQAKGALEATLQEKKTLETKLKSSEAVFNERKRNFDHIITIFGEEKKTIIESKRELEEKVKILEAENEKLCSNGNIAEGDAFGSTQERIGELETMLGQSGLARQEQEELITQLEKEKADVMEKLEAQTKNARSREEEVRTKSSELTDLKMYVGKKSQQWETYKEEAAAAKKNLELRFDERCKELDQMQLTLQKHKEYTNDVKRALHERESEIKSLTANQRDDTGYGDTELMSLLEDKERVIEDLTKQVKENNTTDEAKRGDEMMQLVNRNKSLEDEVMGLKSLVFKLEHRAYSKEPSMGMGKSAATAGHRNVSPAMQRSGSNGRAGLKFPSPTRRSMMCTSPTGRGPVSNGSSRTPIAAKGGRSPSHRSSPSPRAVSPSASHRSSLSSRVALSNAITKATVNSIVVEDRRRHSCSSPSRKGYTTTVHPSSTALRPPSRVGRKSSSSSTPLSTRAVNVVDM